MEGQVDAPKTKQKQMERKGIEPGPRPDVAVELPVTWAKISLVD